eukprot:COSAG02_NODE_16081_length_1114_cov_227.284729_1_plen_126_part_10
MCCVIISQLLVLAIRLARSRDACVSIAQVAALVLLMFMATRSTPGITTRTMCVVIVLPESIVQKRSKSKSVLSVQWGCTLSPDRASAQHVTQSSSLTCRPLALHVAFDAHPDRGQTHSRPVVWPAP